MELLNNLGKGLDAIVENNKYLPSGMVLHDIIVQELFDMKSLAALIFLINAGRELGFSLEDELYFISCDSSKKFVKSKVMAVFMN